MTLQTTKQIKHDGRLELLTMALPVVIAGVIVIASICLLMYAVIWSWPVPSRIPYVEHTVDGTRLQGGY